MARQIRRLALGVAVLFLALGARADEAAVRRMMQDKLRGGGQLESVGKTPFGDLYEVVVRSPNGPVLYYVDGRASVIIVGEVIDAGSGRNLTQQRQRELSAIKWETLPLQWAITSVRGTGRRKIAILSDPNCSYCRRFEEDLAKLDDITVHILPWPILSPTSVRQAKSVWCSEDRAKAWNDLMLSRIEPKAPTDCDNPIDQIIDFGRALGANSTPTWLVERGERYSGAMPFAQVRNLLDEASPPKR